MATNSEARALPYFTDLTGQPLESGSIYIGQAGHDPISYPVTVTSDSASSIVLAQPIRTTHGHAVSGGAQVHMFCPIPYSITVMDSAGRVVYTSLNETDPIAASIGSSTVKAVISLTDFRALDSSTTQLVNLADYGLYRYASGDNTSPENLPLVIVASDGGRYYLQVMNVQPAVLTDSSYRGANTQFVQAHSARLVCINRIASLVSAYMPIASDGGTKFELSSASFTVSLPSVATVGTSWVVGFVSVGNGTYTITAAAGQTINDVNGVGATSITLSRPFARVTLRSDGTNWIVEDSLFNRAVQNGTGTNQIPTNTIKIGWNGTDSLLCDVDATTQGGILTSVVVSGTGIGSLRLLPTAPAVGAWVSLGTVSGSSLWLRVS